MQIQGYNENIPGVGPVRSKAVIENTAYTVDCQDRIGATAGLTFRRNGETVSKGFIKRIFLPGENKIGDDIWTVFKDLLKKDIYNALREEPACDKGMPGDEIIYAPKNEAKGCADHP